jgi:hypothetical protein
MFVSFAVVVGDLLTVVRLEKSLVDIRRRCCLRAVVHFAILVAVLVNLMFLVEMTLP